MRINRAAVLTAACVTGLLGLPAPFAAAAEPPALLYVDNSDKDVCSDAGQGTEAQPFCTVQKAVDQAGPGQTVLVTSLGYYYEPFTVKHSGEQGKPLTVRGYTKPGYWTGSPVFDTPAGATVTLDGVHDVVVENLSVDRGASVSGSTRVTLSGLQQGHGQIKVTGGSNGVTVARSAVDNITVDAGSTGTKVLRTTTSAGIRVNDAPDTVVTNNTAGFACTPGIAVTGSSTRTSLFNNIVRQFQPSSACAGASDATAVRVDSSATGTLLGSNLINVAGGTAYSPTTTPGARDLVQTKDDLAAAIDSADATAPGALEPDFSGNPAADDPSTANTGKGSPAYLDRGAIERQDPQGLYGATVKLNYGQAPYGTDIVATAGAQHGDWPTTVLSYTFDFGDGTPVVTQTDPVAHHAYTKTCDCSVKVTVSDQVSAHQATSATAPVTVTTPGELTTRSTVTPALPTSTNPMSYIAPLSVSVSNGATVSPWPVVSTVVEYGDGKQDSWDYLASTSHQYASPGDYTVRTTVKDSQGKTSTSVTPVHVDYAPSGFLKTEAYRVLDRRSTGWQFESGGNGTVQIPVGTMAKPVTSGSIASVVLNVTVANATADTHFTVWPAGQPRPITSNVNVAAGKTSANLVTVPLGLDNSVGIYLNAGRADVIIDVVGYYQPNVGEKYSAVQPSRLTDTRGTNTPLGPDSVRNVKVTGTNGVPANASAVVLNLTSTESTQDTYLTAYPHGSARPVSSNLNPEPGKDKSNQVIVPVGPDGTVDLYNHAGTTHAVIDVFGYYGPDATSLFTPTVPRRLVDTRSGSPLGNDGTMSIATGLPMTATAAALNVTATDATDNTHLIVYADGSNRPGTSNLNIGPRQTVPNHVITPVGTNGKIDIYNHTGKTHVIADLFGYFTKS